SMAGGIVSWQEQGLPVVSTSGMTPEQRDRYSRHILLPEVGVDGQLKMLNAKVLLLGAGGLVRAYSQAAALGVEAAGVTEALPAVDLRVRLDYPLLGKVQHLLQQRGALTLHTAFGQDVVIDFRVLESDRERIAAELSELSAGRIAVEVVGTALVGPDLQPIHGK
ncbi:MAG: DUF1949 domain-containing protein, partial [Symbiobacteriaceae bacterium]